MKGLKRKIRFWKLKNAQKKIWCKSNLFEKNTNPTKPGYLEFSNLLDYLEKYATCSALYLHEFGCSYANKEQIHEMWILRKMIRDADEYKVESKWDDWYKRQVKNKFGESTELDHRSQKEKDGCWQVAFKWGGFDEEKVDEFFEENKDEIVNYYADRLGDLWRFYFEAEDRFKEVDAEVERFGSKEEVVKKFIQPHDIVEYFSKPYYKENIEGARKELCERYDEIGKFIFSPVYRHRDENTEIGYDRRDEKEYKKLMKEYEKLPQKEKDDKWPPFKSPALFMWWD